MHTYIWKSNIIKCLLLITYYVTVGIKNINIITYVLHVPMITSVFFFFKLCTLVYMYSGLFVKYLYV